MAILVSNTLGTAIGDMTATTLGLGFERGALLFSGFIALVAAAYHFTSIPDSVMFWAAYILTRPLGATLGDTLTKPQPEGGLALSRVASSLSMIAAMVVLILLTNQRNSSPAAAEP